MSDKPQSLVERCSSRIMSFFCYLSLVFLVGCGGYTALEPGSQAPSLGATGWIGETPNIDGKVYVVEAFATW